MPGRSCQRVKANGVRLGIMAWWVSQDSLSGVKGLQAIGIGSLVALIPGLWHTRHYWTRRFDSLTGTWQRNWGFARYMLGASYDVLLSVDNKDDNIDWNKGDFNNGSSISRRVWVSTWD